MVRIFQRLFENYTSQYFEKRSGHTIFRSVSLNNLICRTTCGKAKHRGNTALWLCRIFPEMVAVIKYLELNVLVFP